MAKGNLLGGAASMRGQGQLQPTTKPGTRSLGAARTQTGNDLIGTLSNLFGSTQSTGGMAGAKPSWQQGSDTLFMPNAYSQFRSPMSYNPYQIQTQPYTPISYSGYTPPKMPEPAKPAPGYALKPEGETKPAAPAAPTGYATGNEALGAINAQLTRGLQPDEIEYIKQNIGYQGGAVSPEDMQKVLGLVKQHKPELLK